MPVNITYMLDADTPVCIRHWELFMMDDTDGERNYCS